MFRKFKIAAFAASIVAFLNGVALAGNVPESSDPIKVIKNAIKTAKERLASRLGYMGSAFIMLSPYILNYGYIGAVTYILGGILLTPQVWIAKQWNLVIININLILGYIIYLL